VDKQSAAARVGAAAAVAPCGSWIRDGLRWRPKGLLSAKFALTGKCARRRARSRGLPSKRRSTAGYGAFPAISAERLKIGQMGDRSVRVPRRAVPGQPMKRDNGRDWSQPGKKAEVKLTFQDWAGLATYACALLLCVRGLVRHSRKPRQTRGPLLGLGAGAGIAASVAAIVVFLLADSTSGAALRLQRWLLWPAGIVFAGSLAVMVCVYLRSRSQRRCTKG